MRNHAKYTVDSEEGQLLLKSLLEVDGTCEHEEFYHTSTAGYICANPCCSAILKCAPHMCPHENYDTEDNFCYDCDRHLPVSTMTSPWDCEHSHVMFSSMLSSTANTYICYCCNGLLYEGEISEEVRLKAHAVQLAAEVERGGPSSDAKDAQLRAQEVLLDGIDRKVEPWERTGLLESFAVLVGHMDGFINTPIGKEERVSAMFGSGKLVVGL